MDKPLENGDVVIARKKPSYPISKGLMGFLEQYNRVTKIQLLYEDLLRFSGGLSVLDENGDDTLWLSVYYPEGEFAEIESNLTKIYTLLHSDGDVATLRHLKVESIHFCTFGNSQPFRIRIQNILNDNHTNFYVKKADASRIYGLELEHVLSPDRMNFLVYKDTLIEQHIMGIPGDQFVSHYLPSCSEQEKAQISKEFVKFNERCLIGLLGDMRSYNYVVIPIHDFDQVYYRIRPIDFDQETYEGNLRVYLPQYFKENYKMVKMALDKLNSDSIEQYQKEMRSVVVKRVMTSRQRYNRLIKVMRKEELAPPAHIQELKESLLDLTYDINFKRCRTMGDLVYTGINYVLKNYRQE